VTGNVLVADSPPVLAACHDAGVTEQRFDLVVRNGTIVTPGHREQADVGITGGRIAQLGGTMTGAGEIDASGLLVIPGGIDAHVHLMCAQVTAQVAAAEPGKPTWADDFWTGSLAAIAGGITTVGNMTFALPGESMTQAVARIWPAPAPRPPSTGSCTPCSPAWATPS